AGMSLHDPSRGLQLLAFNAILIAFFSASQDVVFDAYKVDALDEREMGAGAAVGVLGYRIALLVTGSVALILADQIPWPTVYLLIAILMVIGIGAAIWAPEPVVESPPTSFMRVVTDSFAEFFRRTGGLWGVLILVFILFYQLPDRFAANMATPFFLQIGFSQTEVGAIQGGIGLLATIVGVLAGGAIIAGLGINRSLWIFGVIQILTNLAYFWIANVGAEREILVIAIIVEN